VFTVIEASFDEQNIFSESSQFRFAILNRTSSQHEVIGELLHGSHPRPYTEMKRILVQAFDITNQERYVHLAKMKLGYDKPSALLRKMKLSFREKRRLFCKFYPRTLSCIY